MIIPDISRRTLIGGLGATAALTFVSKVMPLRFLPTPKTGLDGSKPVRNSRYSKLIPGVNGVKKIYLGPFPEGAGFRPLTAAGRKRLNLGVRS